MSHIISVSVIMYVYNEELFLEAAINSILNQTFCDFELIIINDGSTDTSLSVMTSFNDPRIVLYNFASHKGLIDRVNFGFLVAKGRYVARMSASDISLPERLEFQVDFFNNNKDYAICANHVSLIDGNNNIIGNKYYFSSHEKIKTGLLFGFPLCASTVMINRQVLPKRLIRYKKEYMGCEDYKMWTEFSALYKLSNIQIVLLKQRLRIEPLNWSTIEDSLKKILYKQIYVLGLRPNRLEIECHLACFFQLKKDKKQYLDGTKIIDWFKKLNLANEKTLVYNDDFFKKFILQMLDHVLSVTQSTSPFEKK